MTIALPPELATLRDTICALGVEKRDLLMEAVRQETMPEAGEILPWQVELLREREQAVASGQSVPVPWQEAKKRIHERLARSRNEV